MLAGAQNRPGISGHSCNLGERLIFDKHVINAGHIHAMLNTQSGRRITLRVVIDDKNV